MYVCMYACIYECMYECMYVCMYDLIESLIILTVTLCHHYSMKHHTTFTLGLFKEILTLGTEEETSENCLVPSIVRENCKENRIFILREVMLLWRSIRGMYVCTKYMYVCMYVWYISVEVSEPY